MKHENALKTISEVSKATGIQAHVLRFWEDNFSSLKPKKLNGRRYYSNKNIEQIYQIKKLLYDEGLSIRQANKHLKSPSNILLNIKNKLNKLKQDLLKLL